MTGRPSSQELAELLESGEVKAALLLKGEFSDSEADLIRRAWEAGLDAGRSERDTLAARLQAAEQALRHYADEENWEDQTPGPEVNTAGYPVYVYAGDYPWVLARRALEGTTE